MSLLAGQSELCGGLLFYFNQSLARGWDINLAKRVLCNLGERLCHTSKLLARGLGSKLFEKAGRQRERRMPSAYGALDTESKCDPGAQRDACF